MSKIPNDPFKYSKHVTLAEIKHNFVGLKNRTSRYGVHVIQHVILPQSKI